MPLRHCESSLLLGGSFLLVFLAPFVIGHAVDDLPRSGSESARPRSSASARYHFDRQFRQKPARFIRSMFWTSVRSRRCSTRRRKVAASSSMRVLSSIAISSLLSCSYVVQNRPV